MDENDYVLVIGAACIDIHGFTQEKLLYEDSNPGFTKVSCEGVGRNISENLSRLGVSVKLITALGDDIYRIIWLKNQDNGELISMIH